MVEITKERYNELIVTEAIANHLLRLINEKADGYCGLGYSEIKLLKELYFGGEEGE